MPGAAAPAPAVVHTYAPGRGAEHQLLVGRIAVALHDALIARRAMPSHGVTILDDLLAHVAPLGWEHIALTGDYIWNDGNLGTDFRQLRNVRGAFLPQVA